MRGVPPVPIPNTAVKPSAANGSWTLGPARVGRCQVMARFFERRAGPLFCPDFPVRPSKRGAFRCMDLAWRRGPEARTAARNASRAAPHPCQSAVVRPDFPWRQRMRPGKNHHFSPADNPVVATVWQLHFGVRPELNSSGLDWAMARVLRQSNQVADGNADTKVTEPTNHA